MLSNNTSYDFEKSRDRIDEILDESDKSFEELNYIPDRDRLTFKNGFYVQCSALFVDMRNSSDLPNKYLRPTLAKIYRSYISEVVAIMNSNGICKEIRIDGDCISGIYNTPYQADINNMFDDSAKINSLISILNCKYNKRGIDPIRAGIGMDYGRALMIKAGYSGSGLNEIIWMGDVVNEASNLCSKANKGLFSKPIFTSNVVQNNLTEHNKGLLSYNNEHNCYHGSVINISMNEWYENNCNE